LQHVADDIDNIQSASGGMYEREFFYADVTINDFPARSSLSGWSGQGYKAYPTCNKDTPSVRVLGKTTYVGHIRFLKKPHKWRRSLEFNGEKKDGDPPREFGQDQIQAQLARLPTRVKEICSANFFKNWEDNMLKAQSNVVDIMCNLELIYPPAFFDIMIHLVIYLALEALEGGTIHPRWMYPFERFMKKQKNYVRNKAKPEGSIAEGYVAEEALTFSSYYFRDVTTKFNYPDRNVDPPPPKCQFQVFRSVCKLIGLRSVIRFDDQELKKVIWYVLHNIPEIDTYRSQFKSRYERRTTQNTGICSPGGKDGEMYYGQLQEILEFSYLLFKVVLFRLKWFDISNNGRRVQHYVIRNNMTQIWAKVNRLKMINTFSQHKSNKSSTLKICPDDHPTGRSSNM
ncbi:gag-pol polyprotein, partial [Tanacetum coccineum]